MLIDVVLCAEGVWAAAYARADRPARNAIRVVLAAQASPLRGAGARARWALASSSAGALLVLAGLTSTAMLVGRGGSVSSGGGRPRVAASSSATSARRSRCVSVSDATIVRRLHAAWASCMRRVCGWLASRYVSFGTGMRSRPRGRGTVVGWCWRICAATPTWLCCWTGSPILRQSLHHGRAGGLAFAAVAIA